MTAAVEGEVDPRFLLRLDWCATGLFALSATVGTVFEGPLRTFSVVVALALFAAGCVAFLVAYAQALQRSRAELIGIGGLYFLAGTAPDDIARSFRLALIAQVAIGLVSSSIRIYTAVAFGLLVPVLGLGLMGLWAARYGTFAPRPDDP